MTQFEPKKRTFLAGALSATVAAPFSEASGKLAKYDRDLEDTATKILLSAVSTIESAREIGRVLLQKRNIVPNRAEQMHIVLENLNLKVDAFRGGESPLSRHELRSLISATVKDDFSQGKVVDLEGWILSETEANLCLLGRIDEIER